MRRTVASTLLRRSWWAATLCVAVLCAASPPSAPARAQEAAPAAVQALSTTPAAVEDTYVRSADPVQNFGSDTLLSVTADVVGLDNSRGLVRFDLAAFPRGTVFHAATLRLQQTAASSSVWYLSTVGAATAWDEDKVTWNTRPGELTLAPPAFFGPAGDAAEEKQANVIDWVNLWVNGGVPNNGFVLSTRAATRPTLLEFNSREGGRAPRLSLVYSLPPIRVCLNAAVPCTPAPNAVVARVRGGGEVIADAQGLLPADSVAVGERLWARYKVASGNGGALYHTMPAPADVTAASFVEYGNFIEMRLVVQSSAPLWVQDIAASAQWHVQGSAASAARLRARIVDASNFLYSFTDGQFALGAVTIQQRFEGWDGADLQLHANNTLQPKAFVGGVSAVETPDFDPLILTGYSPGVLTMGSAWNRFGTPPGSLNVFGGEVYTDAELDDDWSLALAHEFGHWLLYLYDTYTGVDGMSSVALTLLCTGTAMGDVYLAANQNFISDVGHWESNCSGTGAYAHTAGRTEWETIRGWYSWVVTPQGPVAGPSAPPAPVTSVTYVPTDAGAPAAELFTLVYQNGESSSGEARAFLLREDRVIEQGKPAKESTQVQLTGPEVGDRLCVYDLNDHAAPSETPRFQFGCEIINAGDATLVLTRNTAWRPQVTMEQTGPNTLLIRVQQTGLGGSPQLLGRLYPENEEGLAEFAFVRSGSLWSATVTLPGPVPPLYLQLYAGETPGAPATRREVMADRGTGGGGAHGPAKLYTGVLIISSDGNAGYEDDEPVELFAGQSIAWQSMPGTPVLPFHKVVYGQSYLLDAYPASLAEGGTVEVLFGTAEADSAAAAVDARDGGAAGPQLYFWNGVSWQGLPTTITADPAGRGDGVAQASAPSMGEGVYAVLGDAPPGSFRFLPLARR